MNEYTLSHAVVGENYRIEKLHCGERIRRRLQDMGLIEHTKIKCLYISPHKSPIAFMVRGAVIALRLEDCKDIKVSRL